MIEQEPLALVLYDAVVRGPAHDGIEEHTLIGERSVGVVANGIAEEVAVACGVTEIVLAVVLVHPRSLEETVGITCLQGLTILIDDDHIVGSLGKLHHIVAQTYHAAGQGRYIGRSIKLRLLICSRTKVDTFLQKLLGRLVPLELSTPETTEVAIDLSVVILEHTGIDRVGATHGVLLGDKRTLRSVCHSHTKVEHTIVVLGREDEEILAVLLDDIVVPHLLLSPGHLLHIEDLAVVSHLTVLHIFHGDHMVVFHLEVSAIIVEGSTSLPVMGRIDEEFAVKHISRRICVKITRIKITWFHNSYISI